MSNVGALRYAIIRKELAWGEYDAGGTDIPLAFWDDGAQIRPKNIWLDQLHTTGVRGNTHRVRTGRDIAGALTFGLWPHQVRDLLDWATVLDASNDLASYSVTIVDPNIEAMRYYGLRVNTMQVRVSEGDPTLLVTLDLIGKWGERLTAGIPAAPSYAADVSYIMQESALLLDDGGGSYADKATFSSVEINIENNLRPGPHVRDPNADLDKTIASLRTGTQRVAGSFEVEHDGPEWTDALLSAVEDAKLELLFSHPTGAVLTVDAAGAAAGAAVAIPVTTDPTTVLATAVAKEEHVFCETAVSTGSDDKDQRSVAGKVTAVGTGPNQVTVATLDRPLSGGDLLYGHALRIRCEGLSVDGRRSQRRPRGQP